MKTFISLLVILFISLILPSENLTRSGKPKYSIEKLFPLTGDDLNWVDSVFQTMTLREKVAQLVVPYTHGYDTSQFAEKYQKIKQLVVEEKVGGILFLAGDIENQSIIINELQKLAKIPLLISADYERGLGNRLTDAVDFPYKMAFAATGDPNNDYKMGKIVGQDAAKIGIHQNYAPVLDVVHDYRNPIINVRSYSSDADIIAVHSDAFIRGMHESKFISTAKHFPGHGATELDSHNELPLIALTKKQLWNVDLKTFQFAIDAGVKSIMIGHLDVPELTDVDGAPATFSYNVVTKLLKTEMGFDGLVVTDALNMHALTNEYTQQQIGLLSIQAGCDILLFPENEKEMIDGVVESIETGKLPEERLDESVKKILKVKKWLQLDKNHFVNLDKVRQEINKKSTFRLAEDIAEKSITLVKDEGLLLPVNPKEYAKVYSITLSDSRFESTIEEPFLFEKKLNEEFGYVKNFRINFSSKKKIYTEIMNEIDEADLIILSIYANVRSFSGTIDLLKDQFDFINEIIEKKIPTIAISFGNPFILSEVPDLPTYLTTYGNVPLSQSSAVNAILGNIPIKGKLPVALPNTKFQIGDGLERIQTGLFIEKSLSDSGYSFDRIDSLMKDAVGKKVFPGASLLIGHRGRVVFHFRPALFIAPFERRSGNLFDQ